jgi:hypothetical protein
LYYKSISLLEKIEYLEERLRDNEMYLELYKEKLTEKQKLTILETIEIIKFAIEYQKEEIRKEKAG